MNKYEQLIALIEKRIKIIENKLFVYDLDLNESMIELDRLNTKTQDLNEKTQKQAKLLNDNYNDGVKQLRNGFKSFLLGVVLTFVTFLITVFGVIMDIKVFSGLDMLNKIYYLLATIGSGAMTLIAAYQTKKDWDKNQQMSVQTENITAADMKKYRELKGLLNEHMDRLNENLDKVNMTIKTTTEEIRQLKDELESLYSHLDLIKDEYLKVSDTFKSFNIDLKKQNEMVDNCFSQSKNIGTVLVSLMTFVDPNFNVSVITLYDVDQAMQNSLDDVYSLVDFSNFKGQSRKRDNN